MSVLFTLRPTLSQAARIYPSTTRFINIVSSASKMTGKLDLLSEVKIDHENIADLRRRFDEAHKIDDKTLLGRVATTLVEQASVHSDGEEMSVYKKLDEKGLHAIAEHDREEHQEVKQAFKAVDDILLSITEPDLTEFFRHVRNATDLFSKHADDEKIQCSKLIAKMTEDENDAAARDFLKARKMAPTRPHPSAPQHGGITQKVAGAAAKPFDAMINSWRETVPLKYEHPNVTELAPIILS
ncbi:hypothetical protein V8E36_008029 [Tilletia maclaganii]